MRRPLSRFEPSGQHLKVWNSSVPNINVVNCWRVVHAEQHAPALQETMFAAQAFTRDPKLLVVYVARVRMALNVREVVGPLAGNHPAVAADVVAPAVGLGRIRLDHADGALPSQGLPILEVQTFGPPRRQRPPTAK